MRGELGPAAIRYCANRKGTTTAGAHLGSELISSVALSPLWHTRCPSLTLLLFHDSLTVCVCVCVHAGVCHV